MRNMSSLSEWYFVTFDNKNVDSISSVYESNIEFNMSWELMAKKVIEFLR